MTAKEYVLGFDFGTLSCRLLAADIQTGDIAYEGVFEYPSAVISGRLPGTQQPLPQDWYLQDPADYIAALHDLTRRALEKIPADSVAALGIDFTNCTVVALDEYGCPLCRNEQYAGNPHAWVKLWKHHGAQEQASRIERVLREQQVPWFADYGNNVSSEWLYPKMLEVYEKDRDIFDSIDVFLEAVDYIPYYLTGNLVRSSATLGVNAFYDADRGLPDEDLMNKFCAGFGSAVKDKMRGRVLSVGSAAGTLLPRIAGLLGLPESVVISVGHGDSEVAAAGLGIAEPGTMLMVMGTSTCFQMMDTEKKTFDGLCAIVNDGMVPGMYAYESGQPAVGDTFEWFAQNMLPQSCAEAAKEQNLPLLAYMDTLAARLAPGESGLVALDWLNGNRSVLMDYHLSSFVAGLTLATKPEHIFRALLEATAFGARRIFDSYNQNGVPIKKVFAAGGLARKSDVTMQIYADILGIDVTVSSLPNISAMGACVCAAVACGTKPGTAEGFSDACAGMMRYDTKTYNPRPWAVEIYNKLYAVFNKLHDFAGIDTSICSDLRRIQQVVKDNTCE